MTTSVCWLYFMTLRSLSWPSQVRKKHQFPSRLQHSVDVDRNTSDYNPPVDLKRFPREQVHRAEESENPLGAWAWKCHIEDQEKRGGLLAGKTVAIKDNIAVKDVPMLLGTDFIKDFTPVNTTI